MKPTFLAPTPGLFVNGWPAFTVSYPKDWVEQRPTPIQVFSAGALRPSKVPLPSLAISVFSNLQDISDSANVLASQLVPLGKDIKVLYSKSSKLQDGTPAQEGEIEWVITNGPKWNTFLVATKKDNIFIRVTVHNDQGMIGDDLKSIPYSLKLQQGKEEPVKVPPDVREFLDKHCSNVVSHDVEKIMADFSDQFLHFGTKKAIMEQYFRNNPNSPIQKGVISFEATVTVFEARGDKAYVDGFNLQKAKGDANPLKTPMAFQQIIKENGQWKWYGNQK